MRNATEGTMAIIILIVLISASIFGLLIFVTTPDIYAIKDPTREQVEILLRGDEANRVWFNDANQLYQGSSIIKFSFRARYFESDRIPEFLNKVGVKYELIGRMSK